MLEAYFFVETILLWIILNIIWNIILNAVKFGKRFWIIFVSNQQRSDAKRYVANISYVFSHHLLVPFSYVLVLFPKFLEI